MKRILKYIFLTISLLILWAIIIFFGTQNGWWHQAIAEQGESEEYINAVKEKIGEQFVGNFALALIKNGSVEDEIFYSEGSATGSHKKRRKKPGEDFRYNII